jgi:hypothetical protein
LCSHGNGGEGETPRSGSSIKGFLYGGRVAVINVNLLGRDVVVDFASSPAKYFPTEIAMLVIVPGYRARSIQIQRSGARMGVPSSID